MKLAIAGLMATLLATGGASADGSNIGGNERTNGLVAAVGPSASTEIWSRTNLPSLISWTPIVEGDRIFVVRQAQAQNPVVGPGDSIVRCLSMSTGASLWSFDCPFTTGDWTTVVYGARDGRVFVSRGGNGSSAFAPDGPERCSGLPVMHHDGASIAAAFAADFELVHATREEHLTPWGKPQRFGWDLLRRKA